MFSVIRAFTLVLCSSVLGASVMTRPAQTTSPLGHLVLPAGFRADVFAENVTNARSMALGPQGTVFVGSRTGDKVHAGRGPQRRLQGRPRCRDRERSRSTQWRRDAKRRAVCGDREPDSAVRRHRETPRCASGTGHVRQDLPTPRAGHSWKFIAFGPDDMLYMSVGARLQRLRAVCNGVAHRAHEADGSGMEMFAEGIRNSVGFDWHR
jgi:glucose/arabinose dehydrogenase